jgi:PAS domain S-box-containing protein
MLARRLASRSRRIGTTLLLLCGGFACPVAGEIRAAPEPASVRIGILSFTSLAETEKNWAPTAAWLESRIPGHRFHVTPLFLPEMEQAVARKQVDFVFTNPEQYVQLRSRHGLAANTTLLSLAEGRPVNQFGGVIFIRAGRRDITGLADLRGKRIAAVAPNGFGGYLMQCWSLRKAGLDCARDFHFLFLGLPLDKQVEAVLSGKADAGFVRTGVLESLARKGRLSLSDVVVLNRQAADLFPQQVSTDLYPEWPLSTLPHVPQTLAKAVALALLEIPSDSPAARAGGYFGFSPPGNYSAVEAVMVRQGVHPDRDDFNLRDVLNRYAVWIVAVLSTLLALAILLLQRLRRGNRALHRALSETARLIEQEALLLSSLGEGVYGMDQDGRCTFINPAALAMLGYTREEVIGENQHALFHHHRPDGSVYPASECPLFLTRQDGQRRQVEETFIRKNGDMFPITLTVTPVHREGVMVGSVAVFQDISERRRSEARLNELTALNRAVIDSADYSIITTDADGVIQSFNPAAERMLGYAAKEMVGLATPALMHEGDEVVRRAGELSKELGEDIVPGFEVFVAKARRGIAEAREWTYVRKDGARFPVLLSVTALRDGGGEIYGFTGIAQDISERKRAEMETQARTRRIGLQQEIIAAVARCPLVAAGDVTGLARFINQSVAEKMGIERVSVWFFDDAGSQLVCNDLYQATPGTHSSGAVLDEASFKAELDALKANKYVDASEPLSDPRTAGLAETYLKPLNITAMLDAVIRAADQAIGCICFEHVNTPHHWQPDEITFASQLCDQVAIALLNRKRNEDEAALVSLNSELEQRVRQRTQEISDANAQLRDTLATLQVAQGELLRSEKLSSLGALVAGVAHELNTPLGNSLTVATTLADRLREFNREFESGSLRRSALSDFLAFNHQASGILTSSLLKASELITHFKQVAVDQTSAQRRPFDLAEVVGNVVLTLQPQFKATPHRIAVEIPPDISLDSFPGPLGQVLTNLVNNALLHGFHDIAAGRVCISAERVDDQVRLRVSDNGRGIPPEHLSRVFDPFFTTRLGQGGSGLGLHIVYSIVTRVLGGRIMLTSQPGEGTTFNLELPLVAPAQSQDNAWSAVAGSP